VPRQDKPRRRGAQAVRDRLSYCWQAGLRRLANVFLLALPDRACGITVRHRRSSTSAHRRMQPRLKRQRYGSVILRPFTPRDA
jgi:hypothetical protein